MRPNDVCRILVLATLSTLGCTTIAKTLVSGFCPTPADDPRTWSRETARTPTTLIVFVHGFCGDAHQTWASNGFYFPDALATDLSDADLVSFGYARGIEQTSGILNIVNRLRLEIAARNARNYKTIKFVGHSLGGLIVREFVLTYPEFPVSHVILLASPSDGAELATIFSQLIPKNRQAADLELLARNSYLRSLNDRWQSAFIVDGHPRYVRHYALFEENGMCQRL